LHLSIALSAQAALVVFTDDALSFATYAHPSCRPSGIYPTPGLRDAAREHFARKAATGIDMTTLLALRPTAPRALLFLESPTLVAPAGVDLLEPWARFLGLSPVSGPIEQLSPPPTDAFTIAPRPDGLSLPPLPRHRLRLRIARRGRDLVARCRRAPHRHPRPRLSLSRPEPILGG
jgi:hypothetical protein